MFRLSILQTTIAIIISAFTANSQTTYVDNGSATTYTLNSGDSLYINNGVYTGTINTWVAGSKITVGPNASFKPSSFNDNKSKVIVLGAAVFPSLNTSYNFDLRNFGIITVTGDAAMNGGAQTWTNNFGATMTFNGKMSINQDGSSFINNGTITVKNEFTLYATASVINTNTLTFEGDFKTSKGTVNNGGRFYSKKVITLSGSTVYTNTCRTIADNGINIDNGATVVYNSGLLWATNSANNSFITNSGTLINSGDAKIKSVTFTNWGTITGNAYLYFTGTTTGSGTIGTAGTTADSLRVYDVTRTTPPNIFDTQWGTVRPSVKYVVFAAPDTTASILSSCSSAYTSTLNGISILPITWNYFYANRMNDIPVLDWSAAFDASTYYEVQRSYDNSNFVTIATIAAETNKAVYQYTDTKVENSKSVYYRIKGVEPTGAQKLTAVRFLKSSAKNSSLQVSPNPFTNQFAIQYQSSSKDQLVIKIYSGMGQLTVSKTVTTTIGFNQLSVTEAAQLARGIYIVEISNGTKIISAQKIVKQ